MCLAHQQSRTQAVLCAEMLYLYLGVGGGYDVSSMGHAE
jgi:hypothetical protein